VTPKNLQNFVRLWQPVFEKWGSELLGPGFISLCESMFDLPYLGKQYKYSSIVFCRG